MVSGLNTSKFYKHLREHFNLNDLAFFIAHESLSFIDANKIVVWSCKNHKSYKLRSTTGVTEVIQRAPQCQDLVKFLRLSIKKQNICVNNTVFVYSKSELSNDLIKLIPDTLDEHLLICVFVDTNNYYLGGFLLSFNNMLTSDNIATAKFLNEVYSYSWQLIGKASLLKNKRIFKNYKRSIFTVSILAILCMFIRVPQSVIAPVVINAKNTHIISTPMEGVIDAIEVESEQVVNKGTTLIIMDQRDLINAHNLAKRELDTEAIKYKTMVHSGFKDVKFRSDINVQKAKVREKELEVDYTSKLLEDSVIRSPVSGVVILSDAQKWRGKPVITGEKVLEIANSKDVEATISLPVSEALNFNKNDNVKIYLSSNPLKPINAKVRHINFYATENYKKILAYDIYADIELDGYIPRIGSEGTAKIIGDKVSLFYYLFRKPLTFLRQGLGW